MATRVEPASAATFRNTRLMVGLLGLAVFINYVDRGNLATAGPLIRDELHLTNTQFGILVSAFFWSYVPAQPITGWLAHRFSAYSVFASGLALWALATAVIGAASGFAMLLALRLLLGLGESVAFTCSSKLIADHIAPSHLGRANCLITSGLSLGPAFGTLVGGLVMAHYGWRLSFFGFGLISLLWLLPWLLLVRRPADASSGEATTGPSYGTLMQMRSAWATAIGHFCYGYVLYFIITWLPLFLVKSRGFTMSEMAGIGGAIYILQGISALGFGILADQLLAAGRSVTQVMKSGVVIGMIGLMVSMLLCAGGGPVVSVAALFLAGVSLAIYGTNVFAISQTMAGSHGTGKWLGFQNGVSNISGIIGPIVTGFVVDRTGQYVWAFGISALIALIGAIIFAFMLQRIEPVDWAQRAAPSPALA